MKEQIFVDVSVKSLTTDNNTLVQKQVAVIVTELRSVNTETSSFYWKLHKRINSCAGALELVEKFKETLKKASAFASVMQEGLDIDVNRASKIVEDLPFKIPPVIALVLFKCTVERKYRYGKFVELAQSFKCQDDIFADSSLTTRVTVNKFILENILAKSWGVAASAGNDSSLLERVSNSRELMVALDQVIRDCCFGSTGSSYF